MAKHTVTLPPRPTPRALPPEPTPWERERRSASPPPTSDDLEATLPRWL